MNIVLLGAPGSGKGTQAEKISKEFGLYHLQTGAIARELAKKDLRIRKIIEAGKLIPEAEMTMHALDLLHEKREKMSNILFEGFPRFISQYEALENFLKNKGDDIDMVISLDISEKEAVRRVSSRRICRKCGEVYNLVTNPAPDAECRCGGKLMRRKDDEPEAVRVRLKYYNDNTKELIDYLDRKGKLIRVNGERPIDEIYQELRKLIKKHG
jgi:adenylate kinase